ncbi:RNA-directed DNA polymerase, eukaryota [Tanacetum coccineum]
MGKFRLHANATKFSRPPVNSVGVTGKSVINGTKAPHLQRGNEHSIFNERESTPNRFGTPREPDELVTTLYKPQLSHGMDKFLFCLLMNSSQDVSEEDKNESTPNPGDNKGGSVLGVMEDVIRIGQAMGYSMEGCINDLAGLGNKTKMEWVKALTFKYKLNFLAIQETKKSKTSHMEVKFMWGNSNYDFVCSDALGDSIDFIKYSGLVDIRLEGYTYTWSHPSASKMSKLDRFLISDGIFNSFPLITATCLDRHLSDHRPIILQEVQLDFGPIPFRIYHSWFNIVGFDSMIQNAWSSFSHHDSNAMVRLKKKFQDLKSIIRGWIKDKRSLVLGAKKDISIELGTIDKDLDSGSVSENILLRRLELKNKLLNINEIEAKENFQKSKVSWAIEGDENTKFFHGIINKRRSHLAVRGIFVDGFWCTDPDKIKKAFLNHFEARFKKPVPYRFKINFQFPKKLIQSQVDDLEREVSREEIKAAVWNCGENKSPGPDGYTFEFLKKYWAVIGPDISEAVDYFFVKVNGSPSNEFTFHCGLKQGDPLAPYLFILVMESLHLSIRRMVDNGLYKGIQLPGDVSISHMFYTNDGLRINFSKSQLLGVGVSNEVVKLAAASIGCSIMEKKFCYLGVTVGDRYGGFLSHDGFFLEPLLLCAIWNLYRNHTKSLSSNWCAIVREFHSLKDKGFDLLSHCKKRIGNGIDTSFWLDIWIEDMALCFRFLGVLLLEVDKGNHRLLDRWYFDLSGDGEFRVKELRSNIDDKLLPFHSEATRWVNLVPIKVNIFVWRARRDCLSTRANLVHRGIDIESSNYPICLDHEENIVHVLFSCNLAQCVLRKVCCWWDLVPQNWLSFSEWQEWFTSIRLTSKSKLLLEGVFFVACSDGLTDPATTYVAAPPPLQPLFSSESDCASYVGALYPRCFILGL